MKYLIVGLGNIGYEYKNTRHNIGFKVADALAEEIKAEFSTDRLASVAKGKLKGRQIVIIKPSTYMNLSGKAYRYWLDKENIPIENSLVIVDELDLEPGVLRLRAKGSGGSHNGMNHIIEILGHKNFPRLRFGIGDDFSKGRQVDYVLGEWTTEEKELLTKRIPVALDIIKSFVMAGISRTMNSYNNK